MPLWIKAMSSSFRFEAAEKLGFVGIRYTSFEQLITELRNATLR